MFASCKEPTIVGHWKIQTDISAKFKDIFPGISKEAGDIVISADSTYLIKGYSDKVSTTPGWHTGGDETGTWRMIGKDSISLCPDYFRSLIPASWSYGKRFYKIDQLSKDKLVLIAKDPKGYKGIDSLLEYRRQ